MKNNAMHNTVNVSDWVCRSDTHKNIRRAAGMKIVSEADRRSIANPDGV